MNATIVTKGILVALLINHVIFGLRPWGAHMAGDISGFLYLLQIAVCIYASGVALYLLSQKGISGWLWKIGLIVLGLILSAYTYAIIGWQIWTTVHHQGPENLIPFLIASVTALYSGYNLDATVRPSAQETEQ